MKLHSGDLVLVVGFGLKTGVSLARFALAQGARVRVVDTQPAEKLAPSLAALDGRVELIAHGMPVSALDGVKLVLLSPGVPRSSELICEAERRGIAVIGDIELAWHYASCRIVGITGTDGKSTTTSMLGSILKHAGLGRVAGNIGIPVLDVLADCGPGSILALELSSFMLESIKEFKPEVAALLNFAEDHLDRYPDLEAYLAAKLRIFANLDATTTAVWPLDSLWSERFARAVPAAAARVCFALRDERADAFFSQDEKGRGQLILAGQRLLYSDELPLLGRHNLRNALAAAAIAHALRIQPASIAAGLRQYSGLSHRFEDAGVIAGVRFINDSKATTISAVATAIDSGEEGACLLLGGRDKGLDFSPLREALLQKRMTVIPFGEAREKIRNQLNVENTGEASLEAAVRSAWGLAFSKRLPQVILAPGCTSYDEFPNFEVRGEFFKSLVGRIREEAEHG